jgi:hypothetical protein
VCVRIEEQRRKKEVGLRHDTALGTGTGRVPRWVRECVRGWQGDVGWIFNGYTDFEKVDLVLMREASEQGRVERATCVFRKVGTSFQVLKYVLSL